MLTPFAHKILFSIPPTLVNFSNPSLVIYVTINPTSSICALIRSFDFALFFPFLNAIIFPKLSILYSSTKSDISDKIISLISFSSPDIPFAVQRFLSIFKLVIKYTSIFNV